MRVFELAKILNVSSQQIIKDLRRYRVQADSHMASVDDKVVRKLLALYEKRRKEEEIKAAELKQKQAEEELRRKEEEQKRKEEEEQRRRAEEEERKRREEEERRLREEAERKQREEEERKRREEAEARRAKELEKSSSRLAEVLQKRQIESRPSKSAIEEREKKAVGEKRKKPKRIRGKKEFEEEPVPVKLEEGKPFRRRKEVVKKRERFKDIEEKFVEKTQRKQIRPTIFVAQPKTLEQVIPPLPQRTPIVEKKVVEQPRVVELRGDVTVGEFAEKLGVSVADVIKKLMELGEVKTINQVLDPDLCELLAGEFGVNVKIIEESDESDIAEFLAEDPQDTLVPRPPVVTIMGHVDHGKTSLLDYIRHTEEAAQEFGGITQHIRACFVKTPNGSITFIDTPGHEAFTKMRARGAKVTDIVLLVVAADDGVMPQTIEAINHARAADVPIIVAINKVDLPNADVMRVKHELMKYELIPEEFGGSTIFVEVSARTGVGIPQLLEMILLQAEIMELKANPARPAVGAVIESHLDSERGPQGIVVVQRGTLRIGDVFVAGTQFGKVRAMLDDGGRTVEAAGPSFPVRIIGFDELPEAGEIFVVVPNERIARRIADARRSRRRRRAALTIGERALTLESIHEFFKEGKVKELRIILKADVQGTLEAISESLKKLVTTECKVNIIHQGVGKIHEADVDLAIASQAIIIGFNVVPDSNAKQLAEQKKVDIRLYRIIYELIDDVKKALVGLLEPKYREVFRGRALVKQVFKISAVGTVAGCLVEEGEVSIKDRVRLIRDGIVVFEGTMASLRRVKDDVSSVRAGTECGIRINNYDDIKVGDVIVTYQLEEIKPTLEFLG